MERGNDFCGVLTRGEIEVLPCPDQPSIVYFSLILVFFFFLGLRKIQASQKLLTFINSSFRGNCLVGRRWEEAVSEENK